MTKVLSRQEKEELLLLLREKKLRQARNNFFSFCRLLEPDFYKKDRWHLELLCNTLQDLYENKLTNDGINILNDLMINLPPRHGKSRTLVNFCAWVLGKNPKEKILTVSSGDDLANDFSRFTRDMISKSKLPDADILEFTYSDVFPLSKIAKGNASVEKWALEGRFFSYLSAGYQSNKITGRGFTIIICDDLISGIESALNANVIDKINKFIGGTLNQRKEKNTKTIFNMTRWTDTDPCGVILNDPKLNKYWYQLKIPVRNSETKELICTDIFDEYQYKKARDEVSPLVFSANYYQEPINLKGSIYNLQTYEEIPEDAKDIYAYCDVADGGGDFLSCPIGKVRYDRITKKSYLYILDWLYSDQNTDITENLLTDILIKNKVDLCKIESNAGGRIFASNIRELLRKKQSKTYIETFAQKENKLARILSNYSNINKYVLIPVDFFIKNRDAAKALYSFQKDARNKNDDAPDSLTGLYEMLKNEKGSGLSGWN